MTVTKVSRSKNKTGTVQVAWSDGRTRHLHPRGTGWIDADGIVYDAEFAAAKEGE